MPHRVTASGLEVLTHLDEDLVRGLAHQRDQLSTILQVHRAYAMVRLGTGRVVPVEVGATRTPTVATVFADGDFGVAGVVSAGHRTELAADRQLPADVGLGFQKIAALAGGEQVSA